MAEDEVAALKKALHNQLQIIKRLHTELEEERQASASGADEALTMILRLQKEKAEERMEACQYKQTAESKLHHAEETLAMLEQVICQRDIEIASLKHHIQGLQAVTQVLLSGGANNADIVRLSKNQRFSSSSFLRRTTSCVQVGRRTSMPSIQFTKLCSEIAINEGDGSLLSALQSVCREIGNESSPVVHQIQEVNSSRTMLANNRFQINMRQSFEEESTPCSWHSSKKVLQEPLQDVEQLTGIPESMAEGTDSCSLGDDDASKNTLKLCTSRNGTSVNIQPDLVKRRDQAVTYQSDVEQLKCQVQQIADDIRIMKHEDLKKGEEQLNLLRKVHEQLKLVQPQIKISKSKKSCPQDEGLFVALTEVCSVTRSMQFYYDGYHGMLNI